MTAGGAVHMDTEVRGQLGKSPCGITGSNSGHEVCAAGAFPAEPSCLPVDCVSTPLLCMSILCQRLSWITTALQPCFPTHSVLTEGVGDNDNGGERRRGLHPSAASSQLDTMEHTRKPALQRGSPEQPGHPRPALQLP